MSQRLQSRRRVITLLALSASTALGAFALWRVVRGDWAEAVLDTAACLTMLAVLWVARRGKKVELAGILLCVLNSIFAAAGTFLVGPPASGWVYLALVSNFYVAPARTAALSSGCLVIAASASLFLRQADLTAFATMITWTLVCVFTYVFAFHVQLQQGSLEQLANVDPLTQVPNRRAMETDLQRALENQGPTGAGLLVLDIDKFKAVNDRFGHGVGDEVLEALAAVLRAELRRHDRVYRFGGEEFVLLLPALPAAALAATGERIRLAVEGAVRSPGGVITVSVGGAIANGDTEWQNWFARADAALYRAKDDGGNSVQIAPPTELTGANARRGSGAAGDPENEKARPRGADHDLHDAGDDGA